MVSHFRVFGCVYYASMLGHLHSKFNKKVVLSTFVGYDDQRKGWKCCDHELSNSKQIEKEDHERIEEWKRMMSLIRTPRLTKKMNL